MTRKAVFLCGAALLAGSAAAAPPVPGGGPRLEDFRIDERGTVTRPAEPTPAPPPEPTPVPAPAPAPAPSPTESPPTPAPRSVPRAAPAPAPAPVTQSPLPEPTGPDAIAADPAPPAELTAPPSSTAPPTIEEEPVPAAPPSPAPAEDGGPAWPWLLVPLALAGIGLAAWRFKGRPAAVSTSIDLAHGTETPDLAGPVPLAEAAPEREALAPVIAHQVTTAPRPQVELSLEAAGATLNEGELEVRFTLHMRNTGDAPAQNMRLASKLLSGGHEVEGALQTFYADRLDNGIRVPQALPPQIAASVRGRVRLKTDEMKLLTVKDRTLLVPLIAVNLRYGWAEGEGQTAQSFVLGRELDPPAPRMAPLPVSSPPRVYRGLGTRPHRLALVA